MDLMELFTRTHLRKQVAHYLSTTEMAGCFDADGIVQSIINLRGLVQLESLEPTEFSTIMQRNIVPDPPMTAAELADMLVRAVPTLRVGLDQLRIEDGTDGPRVVILLDDGKYLAVDIRGPITAAELVTLNDCPNCGCCTARVCRDKTWQDPSTPQNYAAVLTTTGAVCICEVRHAQTLKAAARAAASTEDEDEPTGVPGGPGWPMLREDGTRPAPSWDGVAPHHRWCGLVTPHGPHACEPGSGQCNGYGPEQDR